MVVLVRAQRRTPTGRVLGWLLAAAAGEFALLAVTGVFLIFFYRPSAAHAWGDIRGVDTAVRVGEAVRIVHRLTARVMVLTVLALAAVALTGAIARSLRTRGTAMTAVASVAIAVVGLFASFTGYLLPWDQLALWAVTVGTNMVGFMPVIRHSHQVQYVLIGGAQISVDTLRLWLLVHVLVVPCVLIGLALLIVRRLAGRRDEPEGHTGLGS